MGGQKIKLTMSLQTRYKFSVVNGLRSAACGTDHFLVLAKVRQKLKVEKEKSTLVIQYLLNQEGKGRTFQDRTIEQAQLPDN